MLRKPRKRKVSWVFDETFGEACGGGKKDALHLLWLLLRACANEKKKRKQMGWPECRHMTNPAPTAVATCKQRRHSHEHEPGGRWWRRSWQPEASMQEQQHTRKANAISQTQYARQTRNVAWCLRNCQEETQQTNTCGCKSQGADGTGLPDFPPVLSEPERRRKTAGLP